MIDYSCVYIHDKLVITHSPLFTRRAVKITAPYEDTICALSQSRLSSQQLFISRFGESESPNGLSSRVHARVQFDFPSLFLIARNSADSRRAAQSDSVAAARTHDVVGQTLHVSCDILPCRFTYVSEHLLLYIKELTIHYDDWSRGFG